MGTFVVQKLVVFGAKVGSFLGRKLLVSWGENGTSWREKLVTFVRSWDYRGAKVGLSWRENWTRGVKDTVSPRNHATAKCTPWPPYK